MEEIKKYIKIVESRGVLGAEDGGLTLFINDENIELGKTPEEVAEKLKDIKDLDLDDLFASSSVDFADEYGFDNEDDAHELFDKAIALMVPKPDDRARDKVDDRPATSDDIDKINKGEEIEEAVGEYSYTLEYNGERNGYSIHKLTITSPEGESKEVADDFTYFEPEEQGDMQDELESCLKMDMVWAMNKKNQLKKVIVMYVAMVQMKWDHQKQKNKKVTNMKNIILLILALFQSRLVQNQ